MWLSIIKITVLFVKPLCVFSQLCKRIFIVLTIGILWYPAYVSVEIKSSLIINSCTRYRWVRDLSTVCFTAKKAVICINGKGGLAGSTTGLHAVARRENLRPYRVSNPRVSPCNHLLHWLSYPGPYVLVIRATQLTALVLMKYLWNLYSENGWRNLWTVGGSILLPLHTLNSNCEVHDIYF